MRHNLNKNRIFLQIAGLVLAVVFVVSIIIVLSNLWEKNSGTFSGDDWSADDEVLSFNGEEYVRRDNVETFLFIGLDTFDQTYYVDSYNNGQLADFLLLLVLDHDNKSVSALQINRDTIAKINVLGVAGEKIGTVEKQIAYSHTYGNGKESSCRNVANAISKLLGGVSIKHYASSTMDAVPVIADSVNGVTVTLLSDFTDIDPSFKKGETVTLRGENALAYVRSRYGLEDSTNESRMERQRQFLSELRKRIVSSSEKNTEFISNTALELSEYIISDCSVNQLESIMEKASSYEFTGIKTIDGKSSVKDGYMEFRPNDDSVKQVIVDLFYRLKK